MKGNIKRIGLVLLTLLTLSLGTLVVNAETKDSDFVIENGVLKQYKGNDDTVYIPEGVTKITSDAFKREYSDNVSKVSNTTPILLIFPFIFCTSIL